MQTMKKVISVVLAVIMVASVFVFSSSAAGAAAPSGDYKISMGYELVDESGKPITSVEPGQIVKLYVYLNSSSDNDEMTGFYHSIYFDDSIYTFVEGSEEWLGISKWIDKNASSAEYWWEGNTTGGAYTNQSALWTEEEKADEPNWDSFIYVMGAQNTNDGDPYTVKENADEPMYSLTFKVSTEASIGASANFGCPASLNCTSGKKPKSYNYTKTKSAPNIAAGVFEPSPKLEISVASAETPFVEYSKTQIRFHGITAKDSPASAYKDAFDVRTVARISEENFQAKFAADDETAATMIAEAGFVYAVKSKVPTMDYAKAQEVAEGGSANYYEKVPVQYMQHANGEYIFTCLITDIDDAFNTDGISCIAYVKGTDGTYYYLNGVKVVNYADLFELHFPKA